MGKRKALEFQSFVREIKVRSKDDLRMEAIGRGQIAFKCEFKMDKDIDVEAIQELIKSVGFEKGESNIMQEQSNEKPTLDLRKSQLTPKSNSSIRVGRPVNVSASKLILIINDLK